MKIDKYTKVILTIIAACLLLLTLEHTGIIPSAKANNAPATGAAAFPGASTNGTIDVRIVGVGYSLNAIPIELKSSSISRPIPVKIENSWGSGSYVSVREY